ncbi:MAG: DUF4292 domain-containing protein [Bacteroidetes bacterium]|nr:MAG: DUF4292 domain-containing protein [Bacteroidota bacterium]
MLLRKNSTIFFFALLLMVSIAGCRGPREVVPEVRPLSTADIALMELHNNRAEFDWFSTRFSGSVDWEGRTHSIAGSMRIRKDSAIYISIAPILGIEVARALITPDSVKLVNRLESTYYMGDLKILSTMFNADVDFYMLQALLTGNDFPHFRSDQFILNEDAQLLRLYADSRSRKSGVGQPIQQLITLDPGTMRIRTNIIEHKQTGQALRADYKRYETIGGRLLPAELQLLFADKSSRSNLEMVFNRTTINVPQNMQFSVPSRYTQVRLTD